MYTYNRYRTELFKKLYTNVNTETGFSALAMEIFNFQYSFNPVYKRYCDLIGKPAHLIQKVKDIPFLPIQLYKSNTIKSGEWHAEAVFQSSSTTGLSPSINYLQTLSYYERNTVYCFENILGSLNNFTWFALLPSYLEKGDSSLVYMTQHFMERDPLSNGGFYLDDYERLLFELRKEIPGRKKILLGVSYALLDLANEFKPDLNDVMIMETGGMKGRGKELSKEELYDILKMNFNASRIHSEYGMTELMSQAYTQEEGIFNLPPTMKVFTSDLNDPFQWLDCHEQGRIHIIDLANIDTCSFLATDDMGIVLNQNQFKVMGRTDASEMRGCNLLYTG